MVSDSRHIPVGRGFVMELLIGYSKQISEWVKSKISTVYDFGPCEAIGVIQKDKIIAGVVYHEYRPTCQSIQISMAAVSPMWARKTIIAQLLKYPFEQIGVYRVYTATPISNTMALKVNEHIGFVREAVCNSMYGMGRHGVLMRFLKPDYNKLYREKLNEQKQPITTSCS